MLIYSFILALIGYGMLVYGILFKNAIQPLSATLLWLVLDGLAAWTAYHSGGNWLLAAGYTVGVIAAALATIYRGHTTFVRSDAWVSVLVLICVFIWQIVGNVAGLVASSTAMFIAGVPVIILYAKRPQDGQLSVWVIWSVANLLSLLGRNGNSLEDWIFPAFACAGSGVGTLLITRKFFLPREEPT